MDLVDRLVGPAGRRCQIHLGPLGAVGQQPQGKGAGEASLVQDDIGAPERGQCHLGRWWPSDGDDKFIQWGAWSAGRPAIDGVVQE